MHSGSAAIDTHRGSQNAHPVAIAQPFSPFGMVQVWKAGMMTWVPFSCATAQDSFQNHQHWVAPMQVIVESNSSNSVAGSSTTRASTFSAAQPWTDECISQLLHEHFQIDPMAFLQAAQLSSSSKQQANPSSRQQSSPSKPNGTCKAAADAGDAYGVGAVKQYTSVDSFVEEMSKLLDLERQAEVERAQEATNICSTSTAQVRPHGVPAVVALLGLLQSCSTLTALDLTQR